AEQIGMRDPPAFDSRTQRGRNMLLGRDFGEAPRPIGTGESWTGQRDSYQSGSGLRSGNSIPLLQGQAQARCDRGCSDSPGVFQMLDLRSGARVKPDGDGVEAIYIVRFTIAFHPPG